MCCLCFFAVQSLWIIFTSRRFFGKIWKLQSAITNSHRFSTRKSGRITYEYTRFICRRRTRRNRYGRIMNVALTIDINYNGRVVVLFLLSPGDAITRYYCSNVKRTASRQLSFNALSRTETLRVEYQQMSSYTRFARNVWYVPHAGHNSLGAF